jgi:phospholipid transport system substrate-binding protein
MVNRRHQNSDRTSTRVPACALWPRLALGTLAFGTLALGTLALGTLAPGAYTVAAEATASAAPAADPQQVVGGIASELLAALARNSAAIKRNADNAIPLIDQLLAPHFDYDYTARVVLGRHWSTASAAQRQQFAAAFYRTLLRTYAGAVATWTPERFKLLPLRSDPAALQVTVRTLVMNPGGVFVPVDYRLRDTPDGWKIFDVVVEGVSYDRNYRDDVDADASRNGLDAVIARLSKRDAQTNERAPPASPPHRE